MALTRHDPQHIETRIRELVRQYVGLGARHGVPAALEPVMDMVVDQAAASSEGGKRLRALLTMDTYAIMAPLAPGEPYSEQEQRAQAGAVLDLACAIEVFQTAALVHDDIIDDSDMRRGKPSAHRALAARTNESIGMGLGLMLGDLLATACVAIMDASASALPHAQDVRAAFIAMHHDVEIGQVLDLAIERMPLDDPDALRGASAEVFRWKTASYTTIAPLHLAFLSAGMNQADAAHHAEAIGLPLGVAFQLADDLLDVVGSSSATGKPVGGDIREGKRTVLLADALADASSADAARLRTLYAAPSRTDAQVREVIALFERTGAIAASQARIRSKWEQTVHAIGEMGLDDGREEQLAAVCARFVPGICTARGAGTM